MDVKRNREFILKTENLVKPIDVTTISFLGDFNKYLPLKTQHKMMKKGSNLIPYMGFIVDPYCYFLSYEIKNIKKAEALLPKEYELLNTSIFEDEEKKPSLIMGVFSARTSAFIGTRMEIYLIARNKQTGKAAWIILDYETNTNSYDPATGFTGYTSDTTVFTTTPYGELLVDIKNDKSKNRLSIKADISKGIMRPLDQTLWVEGNLAVDYGGKLQNDTQSVFSLIFDPILMKQALNIPLESVNIEVNNYLNHLITPDKPICSACFPYSQHYIIKQDNIPGEITNEDDLEEKITEFTSVSKYKTMKGEDIKKPIMKGMIASSIITYGIIIFLLIKLLS